MEFNMTVIVIKYFSRQRLQKSVNHTLREKNNSIFVFIPKLEKRTLESTAYIYFKYRKVVLLSLYLNIIVISRNKWKKM